VAGEIPHDTWRSPICLWNVSQAGVEPASGGTGALLFSQCNVAWRNFVQANRLGVQGVKVLILPGALFLPSMAPASQQDF
jgi:hypothetical protein